MINIKFSEKREIFFQLQPLYCWLEWVNNEEPFPVFLAAVWHECNCVLWVLLTRKKRLHTRYAAIIMGLAPCTRPLGLVAQRVHEVIQIFYVLCPICLFLYKSLLRKGHSFMKAPSRWTFDPFSWKCTVSLPCSIEQPFHLSYRNWLFTHTDCWTVYTEGTFISTICLLSEGSCIMAITSNTLHFRCA